MDNRNEKIVSLIKSKGPVVPGQISSEIGYDNLLTSAMLSELASSKKLLISHIKVGSSPLYYLPEQKYALENFINHLPLKEKEAFLLLKKSLLLDDSKIEPAYRVAFRNLKDFAVPIQVSQNGEERIFWRMHSFSPEEAASRIKEIVANEAQKIKDETLEKPAEPVAKPKPVSAKRLEKQRQIEAETSRIKGKIAAFAKSNNIEIAEELKSKKNELYFRVLIESSLGKIEYLMAFSNKGVLESKDINTAARKGKSLKMPVLFLSNGQPNKGAEKKISSLKCLLIFKKLLP